MEEDVVAMENAVKGLNEITLRAYLGKQQGALIVRPMKSERTGQLMGVPRLSDDERKKASYVVTHETERKISDGTVIKLNEPVDEADWGWIKYCPELKGSLEECYNDHRSLFYIENVKRDVEIRINARNIKKKAFRLLEEASFAKQIEICSLLGVDVEHWKPYDIEDYLGDLCETNAKRLLEAFEDEDATVKLFINDAIRKKIVVVDSNNIYKFGSTIMGTDYQSTIDWIKTPANAKLSKTLYDQVNRPATMLKNDFLDEDSVPIPSSPIAEPLKDQDAELDQNFQLTPEAKTGLVNDGLDSLSESQIRDKYKEVFGKGAGNMNISNIVAKIREELDGEISL
jgi:hypothetical protein